MSKTLAHVAIERQKKVFNASIQHMFESQVKQTPTAIGAFCDSAQLTYQELNRHANRVAHRLQKPGVGAETLVGISVECSLNMLLARLATVKAGGAFVPLDPSHPQKRLAFLLADSNITVLLTQERLLAHLPQQNAHVVCVDKDDTIELPDSNPPCVISEENAAYIIYTSGSTGQPTYGTAKIPWHRRQSFPLCARLSRKGIAFQATILPVVQEYYRELGQQLRMCLDKIEKHKDKQ